MLKGEFELSQHQTGQYREQNARYDYLCKITLSKKAYILIYE